jgi:pyruvate formate lyase activating enzyme
VEEFCSGCREEGLSVAIESCGAVPFDSFRRVLPLVVLILYDVKAVDPKLHKAWTGSSNELILSNLDRIRESGIDVIPRVPIVPEHTALASNLHQIAAHLEGRFREVHLLPYHGWGESKRDLIDSQKSSLRLDPPTEEEMQAIGKIFEERGILVRIGG